MLLLYELFFSFVAVYAVARHLLPFPFDYYCRYRIFPLCILFFLSLRILLNVPYSNSDHVIVIPNTSLLDSALWPFPSSLSILVKDLIMLLLLYKVFYSIIDLMLYLPYLTTKDIINIIGSILMPFAKQLPFVSNQLNKVQHEVYEDVHTKLRESVNDIPKVNQLPEIGMKEKEILNLLQKFNQKEGPVWKEGYVSGAVYAGEEEHLKFLGQVQSYYNTSNPLHPQIWPSLMKFESEVIAMTSHFMHGKEPIGCMTSGGTESIILAVRAHMQWYREEYNITNPEIISCITAHAALDKACEMFHIKLIKVPTDKTGKIDLKAVEWYISGNTILLYGSAYNFPHGIIDDIAGLSELAIKYNVGLHVDCCLGGFILPFVKELYEKKELNLVCLSTTRKMHCEGDKCSLVSDVRQFPQFDFELSGVTSISCDTHKYGYSSKGTSVVLYRNAAIRAYQYFTFPEWSGGLYVTPTVAGSRPGELVVGAWAAMMKLGHSGYLAWTKKIMETTQEIILGIQGIPDLCIVGCPLGTVVSFSSNTINIFGVGDRMKDKGWHLNALQYPTCLHLCVTLRQVGKGSKFVEDLTQSVAQEKKDCTPKSKGTSAIYGMSGQIPSDSVNEVLRSYVDGCLDL